MAFQTTYSAFPAVSFLGEVDEDGQKYDYLTLRNQDSVSIPFGTPVAWLRSSPTSDLDSILPAASTDVVAGIVVRNDDYARTWTDADGNINGNLDGTGVTVHSLYKVLARGRIWVTCKTGCKPGDKLFVAYGSVSTYTGKGQMGNVAEGSNTLDYSASGMWDSTAAANSGAWLKVNF